MVTPEQCVAGLRRQNIPGPGVSTFLGSKRALAAANRCHVSVP